MKLTETVGLTGSAAGATSAGVEAFSHSLEPLAAYVAWEAQHLGVHLRFVCVLVPPGARYGWCTVFGSGPGASGVRPGAVWRPWWRVWAQF